jgi:patatin-like phospholipase/acyl hydrolase
MIPFRKNVAIAIDGGGIRGIMVTRALMRFEEHIGRSCHEIFRLATGTSTGSIIAAGIAAGFSMKDIHESYGNIGRETFKRTFLGPLWLFEKHRYSNEVLREALDAAYGELTMGSLWKADPPTDLVITVFDLLRNRTCFIKPWKKQEEEPDSNYAEWRVAKTVLASCATPSYFPAVEGRYVDGGVGAYNNPCFLAAYEIEHYLRRMDECSLPEPWDTDKNWDPAETTLISLGTGLEKPIISSPEETSRLKAWEWIEPVLGAFQHSAILLQVRLVKTFFREIDFRRFQVPLDEVIKMDDAGKLDRLEEYGERLWEKMLNDEWE